MSAEVESEFNELPDLTAEMKAPEDFVKSMLPPDQELQLEPKSAVSMRPKCEGRLRLLTAEVHCHCVVGDTSAIQDCDLCSRIVLRLYVTSTQPRRQCNIGATGIGVENKHVGAGHL